VCRAGRTGKGGGTQPCIGGWGAQFRRFHPRITLTIVFQLYGIRVNFPRRALSRGGTYLRIITLPTRRLSYNKCGQGPLPAGLMAARGSLVSCLFAVEVPQQPGVLGHGQGAHREEPNALWAVSSAARIDRTQLRIHPATSWVSAPRGTARPPGRPRLLCLPERDEAWPCMKARPAKAMRHSGDQRPLWRSGLVLRIIEPVRQYSKGRCHGCKLGKEHRHR
jgi:hypothetical protein